MRRLIIIGNGFDRAHKLKTSYGDFIEDLVTKSIHYDSKIRENLLNVSYLDSEIQSFEYIKKNYENLSPSYHNNPPARNKIIVHNHLLDIFLRSFFQANWVDVEEKYYQELCGSFNQSKYNEYDIDDINNEFSIIKSFLQEYLANEVKKSTIDVSGALLELMEPKEFDNILLLVFNYTPIASRYFELLRKSKNKEILHIHGELFSDQNPIIFGYGDENDRYYDKLLEQPGHSYLENLKRPLYKTWDAYDRLKRFLEDGQFETISIGHSLGKSDKTLLKEIFEHQNCKSVLLPYYNNRTNFKKLLNNISKIVPQVVINEKVLNFRETPPIPQLL